MAREPDPVHEPDWSLSTWEGNRRLQHQEFNALPFRRKLELIESMEMAGRLKPVPRPDPKRRRS